MKQLLVLSFVLAFRFQPSAQPYNPAIDVTHYDFALVLNDSTDDIRGDARITLQFREQTPSFSLDLAAAETSGKGMTVTSVKEGDKPVSFTQSHDRLVIHTPGSPGRKHTYRIAYHG